MRRVWLVLIAVVVSASLSGCSLIAPRFTDEAEGETQLLAALQDKYGQEFIVVDNGELEGAWLKRYTGMVAPAAAPEETASARLDSSGRLSDGWTIWEYMDELGAIPQSACDQVSWDVASCDLNPHMPQESYNWSPDILVDQFVEDVHPVVNVQVEFLDSDASTVAPLILSMTDVLSTDPYPFNLYVTRGDRGVVYEYNAGEPTPTLDAILSELG